MNKKILITGGAGFIGSSLGLRLISRGYDIRVLDNLAEQIHGGNPGLSYTYGLIKDKADFIHGDVTDRNDWERALKGVDCIVHLAAETGTGQSMYQIEKYVKTNSAGTALMLDLLANTGHNVSKVIIASSRAIYGEGKYICAEHGFVYPESRKTTDLMNGDFECRCPVCNDNISVALTDEASAVKPSSVYAITKFNQEQLVLTVCKSLGIQSVALRFQNVYGPGQSLRNPYTGIISIFSSLLRQNSAIQIFEDGRESRDFVFIDDVINSLLLALETELSQNTPMNVGTGASVSVLDIAEKLKKIYNSESEIKITGKFRIGDIRHNIADLGLVKKNLGYSPSVSIDEGLARFAEWVLSSNVHAIDFDRSMEELKAKGFYK
jgi:dTDP-L-rhamnose 4-epimerase